MKQRIMKIALLSDLCSGNGESYGNRIDTDIWTDDAGLPLIPGRRLKGCLRESADFLASQGYELPRSGRAMTGEIIDALFGTPARPGSMIIGDAVLPGYAAMRAALSEKKEDASPARVTGLYTHVDGQTKLENGVAARNTLRYTRVLSQWDPLREGKELAFLADVRMREEDAELWEALEACCAATRHMGMHRNRGLGNVRLTMEDGQAASAPEDPTKRPEPDTRGKMTLEFRWVFDSAIDMPRGAIPARSVIGCMAEAFLRDHEADAVFEDLFLNGKTGWSDMTPVVHGQRGEPMPLTMHYFRELGEVRNLIRMPDPESLGKHRALAEAFWSENRGEGWFSRLSGDEVYHHRHAHPGRAGQNEAQLYQRSVMKAGQVFAGRVSFPEKLYETVCDLLNRAEFRIGHSRAAQYAACRLLSIRPVEKAEGTKTIPEGEPVYAVLGSDLVLLKEGVMTVAPDEVRAQIAQALGLTAAEKGADYCAYRVVGGYQNVWGLWKPQMTTLCGGSVFVFRSEGRPVPGEIHLGAFPQEEMGKIRILSREELPEKLTEERTEEWSVELSPDAEALLSALLAEKALEEISRNAEMLYLENSMVWGASSNNGLMSRIRRSLQESETPERLRLKLSGITDPGKKEIALNIFGKLYGGADEKAVLETMLRTDAALARAVRENEKARKQVLKQWKAPLRQILHAAYFAGEREVR